MIAAEGAYLRMRELIALGLFFFLFQGCAANNLSEKKDIVQKDEIGEALKAVPMSDALSSNEELKVCHADQAQHLLDEKPNTEHGHEAEVWKNCQKLFACSTTASDSLRKWLDVDKGTFRLGFADLNSIKLGQYTDRVGGLFIAGTDKVYLDKKMDSYWEACPFILHEVTHRFDPEQKEESLPIEFRAYYLQTAFSDDLYLRDDELGERVKEKINVGNEATKVGKYWSVFRFTTREALMKKVADAYGFKPDYELPEKFAPLPTEAVVLKIQKLGRPKEKGGDLISSIPAL